MRNCLFRGDKNKGCFNATWSSAHVWQTQSGQHSSGPLKATCVTQHLMSMAQAQLVVPANHKVFGIQYDKTGAKMSALLTARYCDHRLSTISLSGDSSRCSTYSMRNEPIQHQQVAMMIQPARTAGSACRRKPAWHAADAAGAAAQK